MAAVAHDPAAGDHRRAHQPPVAGEDEAVEQLVTSSSGVPASSGWSASSSTRSAQQPAAIRPTGWPSAWRAAGERRPEQTRAGVRLLRRGGDVAPAVREALPVLEPAQLLHRAHRDVAVRADADAASGLEIRREREEAVAEIRLGRRTEGRRRRRSAPARGSLPASCASRARGTSARPAGRCSSSHSTGRRPGPGLALVHLPELLGHVDVHRAHRARRRARCASTRPMAWRIHGAQAVKGRTDARRRALVAGEIVRAARDTPPGCRRSAPGAAPAAGRRSPPCMYSTGSSVSRMPGRRRSLDQRLAHRRRVGIGPAARAMVQVVELADRRVAGPQHLDVEAAWRWPSAPPGSWTGPGRTSARARSRTCPRRGPGPLGTPGQGPLEGVAVQIGHAGHQDAHPLAGRAARRSGTHVRQSGRQRRSRSRRRRPSRPAAARGLRAGFSRRVHLRDRGHLYRQP